jgi:hypothetical protein
VQPCASKYTFTADGNAGRRKAFPGHPELKARAKAAKLRANAAKMRLRASQLEQKATRLKRRAEELDDLAAALEGGTRGR